ncbi:unnamed protein product [Peronospora farinosa]|uniref:Uncharacterized protein n=1 Tax=Peronospora farinosa TaxID=134698 RepID=A0AAV0UXU9_9STRA|nr:unnamed protein product [Peronospora farinosa]CAI5741327.1 unnamed protein product [Peronospora farinosa]
MANTQNTKKPNRSVVEENKQMKDQEMTVMETTQSVGSKQMWKQKRPCLNLQGSNESLKAFVPMQPTLQIEKNYFSLFESADRLAEWVFNTAKHRPMQLDLCGSERNEEIRDALLRQFHCWPGTKISHASKPYRKLSQEAENLCRNQVDLYIDELHRKLLAGTNGLFWLNVLQPVLHPELLPRQETQEILLLLLEELKSVDGVYEQLMKKNEYTWDVLMLPLTLKPLFQRVSTLALSGHEIAAEEAMQILLMFVEKNVVFSRQKKATRTSLSSIPSVGPLAALKCSSLRILPKPFRELFSRLFLKLSGEWYVVVDEVLDIFGRSLASRWASCERASL